MTCRIVFMGSPEFATTTLRALYEHFEIIQVFSQADKPTGRGKAITSTPVKRVSQQLGLPCCEPENLRDPGILDMLKELEPDAIVVVAYGKFLPESILELPRTGCLNLHASLLPRHRGPSPISASILSGDDETGLTVMLMDLGMDTGAILSQRKIPIGERDSTGDLHDKLMELGASLMVETLSKLMNNAIKPVPQDDSKATYCRLLRKSDGLLDWNLDAKQLDRIVRAMNPWPGAFFLMGHEPVKVWSGIASEGQAEPGMITGVTPDGIEIGTGNGLFRLEEVQAPSKKRISSSDFARGKRLKEGTYLI
ncbi:MAG: methionyl-tRNA formyltransferase [Deltaproteobacteria bacterium]|nr:methionyl-tRNA formyltransferase [Deltaproteobacteria bacterium]